MTFKLQPLLCFLLTHLEVCPASFTYLLEYRLKIDRVRNWICQVGPHQVEPNPLGRFVGHFHPILEDGNRECRGGVTCQPEAEVRVDFFWLKLLVVRLKRDLWHDNIDVTLMMSTIDTWHIFSSWGIHEGAKWQFCSSTHVPLSTAPSSIFRAIGPWPWPSERDWNLSPVKP